MNSMPTNYLASDASTRQLFLSDFDRRPFAFSHTLHTSELFTFDAISDLATRIAAKQNRWYVEQGDTKAKNGWNPGLASRSLTESLAGIAQNRSLVMLKRIQEEPEYKNLLDTLEEELSDLSGIDIGSHYSDGLMTLLVTSPGRVTPYHLDGEANLLMQIRGTKSVYIFDGNNPEILSCQELEGFWSGNIKAPVYKEHLQDQSWKYELYPGAGVTNPVIFPHWVQNGPEISISISVNFKRVRDDSADAYRINKQLRKFGLHPLPPGSVKMVDHTKGMVYRTAKRFKRYMAAK
jgi:hypothetical protein